MTQYNAVLVSLVSGLLIAAYSVIAVFFLRFWRDTRDRLFIFFASAFFLLAVQRLGLTFAVAGSQYATWLYVVRLLAFVLIICAIVDKNRN